MENTLSFPAITNNDLQISAQTTNLSDGALPNLTGFYIKVCIFFPRSRNIAVEYDTTGGGVQIPDQATYPGQFLFTINATDSVNWDAGEYPWEAVTVNGSGKNLTLANNDDRLSYGLINFRRQLTVQ